ncbi:uncharacterized protein N7483_007597 [Penicillium malachiteum]|uniref:uncharacterized protein n=1 Tax=Penicillium malachiteum TaxID=1324776 RepID=UPI002548922B|nr:uncharacterized protein N7483_007597 [Penicillium malachiteum]KAJ5726240.1 hypothetical protein N7483_007597 [Penicillium malachiteum]
MLCKETAACKGNEVLGSVFIRRTTPPEEDDNAGVTDEECEDEKKKYQKDLQTCTALKDDLQDELDACRRGRTEDKEACDKKIKELEAELSKCKDELTTCKKNECKVDPVWERRKEAMKICGYGGRKTITAGGYTYRAFCQRQATYRKFYKQLSIGVDERLEECSKDTKCKPVHFMIVNDAH